MTPHAEAPLGDADGRVDGSPVRGSRAARVIEQVLASGDMSPAELATAIVVSERTLESYRSGHVRIPLERQLCIALLAIERSAAARRAGFSLRAQVEAELAVELTRSEMHDGPPISHRWP